ncbi:hypothetical protein [Streptomyces sp. NPDC002324]
MTDATALRGRPGDEALSPLSPRTPRGRRRRTARVTARRRDTPPVPLEGTSA